MKPDSLDHSNVVCADLMNPGAGALHHFKGKAQHVLEIRCGSPASGRAPGEQSKLQ